MGCALVPYALALALRIHATAGTLDKQAFLRSISPRTNLIQVADYHEFFEPYFYVHACVQILSTGSLV
eukprot:COSAG01_NODE_28022_length_671_cov_0.982517_2_plen_67_part_01